MSRVIAPLLSASALLLVGTAQASVISINWPGTATAELGSMVPADVAGVVRADNWNNSANNTTTSDLVVSTGLGVANAYVSGASVANNISSNYQNGTPVTDGDTKMMRGYVGTFNTNPVTVTVDNLPVDFTGPGYDVYVYMGATQASTLSAHGYTIGDQTFWLAHNNTTWDGSYARSLSTTRAEAEALAGQQSYVLFTGLTGDSFTLTIDPEGNFRGSIAGMQIVAIPEPGLLGALGAGALLLVRRRR